jgi:hypothetical protein
MPSSQQDQNQLKRGKAVNNQLEMTFEGVTEYVDHLAMDLETKTVILAFAGM